MDNLTTKIESISIEIINKNKSKMLIISMYSPNTNGNL